MTGSELLRAKREHKGLSREELAMKSGVSASAINKIETGNTSLQKAAFGTVCLLAEYLNIPLERLSRADMGRAEDKKYKEFIEAIRKLSDREKAVLKGHTHPPKLNKASGEQMALFYSLLPKGVKEDESDLWFAVASWAAQNEEDQPVSFGTAIGEIAKEEGNDRAVKALARMIESGSWDSKYPPGLNDLDHLVRVVKQQGYSVDYARMLRDLNEWRDVGSDTAYWSQSEWMTDAYRAQTGENAVPLGCPLT